MYIKKGLVCSGQPQFSRVLCLPLSSETTPQHLWLLLCSKPQL